MSDYPDRFGVQQFPKYGTFTRAGDTTPCAGSTTTTVFTISAKGRTYGGYLYISDANASAASTFQLWVDGSLMGLFQPSSMLTRGLFNPDISPGVLLAHDTVSGVYTVGLSRDITFESELKVRYVNQSASEITVGYEMHYSIVE